VTDMVIPPAAVQAAAKAIYENDLLPGDWPWSALGQDQERLARGRVALEAALPHLRPLFETATELGLKLGRQEAAEEIAEQISMYNQEWSANTWRSIAAGIARDVGAAS